MTQTPTPPVSPRELPAEVKRAIDTFASYAERYGASRPPTIPIAEEQRRLYREARAALEAAIIKAMHVDVDGVPLDIHDLLAYYNTAKANWDTCLQERDEARSELEQLRGLLRRIEPYIDSIVCYASSCAEHEPNQIAVDVRRAVKEAKQ